MTTATDTEIENAADDIFAITRSFDNPRDAMAAITLAYFGIIKATFATEQRRAAFDAIEADAALVKDMLKEDWQ